MMPIMSGKEMISAMRGDPQLASIPVILMSAARRQIAMTPGEEFPAFSIFLRKPFLLQALTDALIKLIGRGE
jgi:CheY-like chemotaxis protein